MKLNRFAKFIVGALTAWPPLYMLLFIGFMGLSMNGNAQAMFDFFPVVMVLHLSTMAILLGLLGFYTLHAVKNESMEMTPRLLWALMFFVGGIIAMPIYFLMQVLPDRAPLKSPAPQPAIF
ncbi:MAG: hypothetical protein AB8I08_40825 [Sandaracinaceae bacterium]